MVLAIKSAAGPATRISWVRESDGSRASMTCSLLSVRARADARDGLGMRTQIGGACRRRRSVGLVWGDHEVQGDPCRVFPVSRLLFVLATLLRAAGLRSRGHR